MYDFLVANPVVGVQPLVAYALLSVLDYSRVMRKTGVKISPMLLVVARVYATLACIIFAVAFYFFTKEGQAPETHTNADIIFTVLVTAVFIGLAHAVLTKGNRKDYETTYVSAIASSLSLTVYLQAARYENTGVAIAIALIISTVVLALLVVDRKPREQEEGPVAIIADLLLCLLFPAYVIFIIVHNLL